MAVDLSVYLINATVEVEQPLAGPNGMRTVATGFLVADPTPDGRPRIVLVTAKHVFEAMDGDKAMIGYRVQSAAGEWRFAPQQIDIRHSGRELWTENPNRDVAVITVTAPASFAKAAIPLAWLASDETIDHYRLGPGEELMALGFPQGLSANSAGFPILRAGRIASYPLAPSSQFPTFLLDFRVFPGNSGGPVWLDQAEALPAPVVAGAATAAASGPTPCVAGILTQEVEFDHQNLGIGIVTDARFIRETLSALDTPAAAPRPLAKPDLAGAYAAQAAAAARP